MTIRPLRNEPNLTTHRGFLLAEDEALKTYLSGINVPGRDGEDLPVGVWFRWPEGERQMKYPFITIDLLQATPNFDLFTSTYNIPDERLYQPSVSPTPPPLPYGRKWGHRNFLPFQLVYQVAVHARSHLHDRYLRSIFLTDVFPPRPFWILNPADDAWCRTENVQAVGADVAETTESGTKRIFRKIYTISMFAEIPQDRFATESAAYQVFRVLIPVVDREWVDAYFNNILDGQTAPFEDFTQEERELQGEYFHIVHSGEEVPPALT